MSTAGEGERVEAEQARFRELAGSLPGPHWLTRWDPDSGEPYGTVCDCEINEDHNGSGDPFP